MRETRELPVRPPLVELTLVRVRELLREPEAVFWVFVFPILLAAILGLAFRSRPPEALPGAGVGACRAACRAGPAAGSAGRARGARGPRPWTRGPGGVGGRPAGLHVRPHA